MDGGGLLLDGDSGDSLTQNMKGDSQTADFIHNAFNDLTQVHFICIIIAAIWSCQE